MNFTSDKKKLLSLGLVLLILLIGVGAIVASNYKAFFNTTSTSQSALDTEILRLEKEIAMRPTPTRANTRGCARRIPGS